MTKTTIAAAAAISQIRQGDVLLVRVDEIPADAKQVARDAHGRVVLAEGEHHGHAHAIRDPNVTAFFKEGEASSALVGYIEVGGSSPVALNHEYVDGRKADHNPAPVAPGKYRVVQQREYEDPNTNLAAFD